MYSVDVAHRTLSSRYAERAVVLCRCSGIDRTREARTLWSAKTLELPPSLANVLGFGTLCLVLS